MRLPSLARRTPPALVDLAVVAAVRAVRGGVWAGGGVGEVEEEAGEAGEKDGDGVRVEEAVDEAVVEAADAKGRLRRVACWARC